MFLEALLQIGFSVFVCGLAGATLCGSLSIDDVRGRMFIFSVLWIGWQLLITTINIWSASFASNKDLYDALSIVSFICLLLGCVVLISTKISIPRGGPPTSE